MSRLPNSVQDVADVIGEEKALLLVGSIRRSYPPSRLGCGKQGQVYELLQVYIPRRLPLTHDLVRILGWETAVKLSRHFSGEILTLGNCAALRRHHRNEAMRRMSRGGMATEMLAELFCVTSKTVKNVLSTAAQIKSNV